MNAAMMVVLVVLPAALPAGTEPLGDDLCAFAVEGLTLASTKADADAVFAERGWLDLSSPRVTQANGVTLEQIEFDRTRRSDAPEEVKADKDGPVGRFQLVRDDAGGRSIRLSDYTDEPPVDRARALCAAAAGRFNVSGCEERFLSRDQFGVIIRPLTIAPGASYCTVTFNGAKTFYGQTYTVSVAASTQQGRAKPASPTGRRRGSD